MQTSITAEKDEAALARKQYRAPKRTQAAQQQQQCEYIHTCVYKRGRFHKPGIYGGRVRERANQLDVFHCTPSRGGHGRRAAVDIFRGVCLVFRGIPFFFFVFFTSNAHGLLQVRATLASCTSLLVMITRQGRWSEATEAIFLHFGKKASSYRGAYRVPLFNSSVRVCDIRHFY